MTGSQLPQTILILLFLLLPSDASASAKPQYVVLVPSQLYAGIPEKACVTLNNLNETVTLNVTLEHRTQSRNLFTHQVTERSASYCSSFTVQELPSPLVFVTVQIKGPTQHFIKRKSLHIAKVENPVFVQTDKPIYKPGQTVRFRIVSMDGNFHPVDKTFPVIYIENPKYNRIFQWQSFKLQGGLSQLSFPLSVEPVLGSYKIVVLKESAPLEKKIEHSFEVKEYVLPKFEVQVKMPKTIAFTDEELEVSACGSYTYGKPVPGLVTIKICRKFPQNSFSCQGKYSQNICAEFSQQADNRGCFSQLIKMKMFQLKQKGYSPNLHVEATVKEEGTGLELTGHGVCDITNVLSRLKFTKVDSYYRPGIPFGGQVLLVDEKNQPIPNQNLTVRVSDFPYHSRFTTDSRGLADISLDTRNLTSSFLTIWVTYKENSNCYDNWWLDEVHAEVQHTATQVFSLSKSYLHLELVLGTLTCGQDQEMRVQYILNQRIFKEERELAFYYLIKARGSISKSGVHMLPIEEGNMKGTFSFSFRVEPDMAPSIQLVVYTILPNEELVTDTQTLQIEHCFANKVSLSFSSAQGLPASDTHLKVTAAPQSLCALRAVDQSVLLMKPEAELSPKSVFKLLPVKLQFILDHHDQASRSGENCISRKNIIQDGIEYEPKQAQDGKDAFSFFEDLGLDIFTNSKIHKPHLCSAPQMHAPALVPLQRVGPMGFPAWGASPPAVASFTSARLGAPDGPVPVPVKETVRKYFPETWIWDLVVLNSSGSGEVAVKAPDSITEWKASAFCLSKADGFGLSSTTSFQVFQPLFLDLTLPYSVVRGEAFILKATAFNYLPHCIQVRVKLEDSSAFLAVPVENHEEFHCVCGNERKTVSWAVTPKSLGKVNFTATVENFGSREPCGNEVTDAPVEKDTIVKPLIVEPEGIEKEETYNTLFCTSETKVPDKLSLKVPPNVVEGSARATYSVLGDILGSAMKNLQNLLKMPYGCGEQNMVLFVPNIYVLNYLNETQQLTEKIKSKAIGYLVNGYQRQLNYKHEDGSYSAFGDHGGQSQGNTWLTAFVLKAFSQAQPHIFVENSHITSALSWLSKRQKEDGCFQRVGSLLHNAMKGGVDDEVTLSAYITIALLEMPLPVSHSVVRNALFCLESAWSSISETQGNVVYTKALLAYAFALAGNQAKRSELLQSLDRDAVKEKDTVHWQRRRAAVPEAKTQYHLSRAPSAEVEMTAYVLLAYLTGPHTPSPEDLSVASRIVKWIIKQQNPYGGFSSTQDTVVALQALSKYGAATFTKSKMAALVTVKSSGAFSEKFQVNDANRLLLQEATLPEVPGDYNSTVAGSGCVYLQTSLRYNILPKKTGTVPFALQVGTLPRSCDGVDAHRKFQIQINVSYAGERPSSNMAIVDVKMVSGFIPVKPSVKKLQEQPMIERTEVNTNHVLIYFKELTNQTRSFSFLVEQDIQIKNLKPAAVKAYDYYETDEFAIEEYSVPCSDESAQGNA